MVSSSLAKGIHFFQNIGMLCMQDLFFVRWVDYLKHCKWSTFLQKERRVLTRKRRNKWTSFGDFDRAFNQWDLVLKPNMTSYIPVHSEQTTHKSIGDTASLLNNKHHLQNNHNRTTALGLILWWHDTYAVMPWLPSWDLHCSHLTTTLVPTLWWQDCNHGTYTVVTWLTSLYLHCRDMTTIVVPTLWWYD